MRAGPEAHASEKSPAALASTTSSRPQGTLIARGSPEFWVS